MLRLIFNAIAARYVTNIASLWKSHGNCFPHNEKQKKHTTKLNNTRWCKQQTNNFIIHLDSNLNWWLILAVCFKHCQLNLNSIIFFSSFAAFGTMFNEKWKKQLVIDKQKHIDSFVVVFVLFVPFWQRSYTFSSMYILWYQSIHSMCKSDHWISLWNRNRIIKCNRTSMIFLFSFYQRQRQMVHVKDFYALNQ